MRQHNGCYLKAQFRALSRSKLVWVGEAGHTGKPSSRSRLQVRQPKLCPASCTAARTVISHL